MTKKLINYLIVVFMTLSLVVPFTASANSVSISSKVVNVSTGGKSWSSEASAKPGDELIYSMTVVNTTTSSASGLNAYAQLPSGLEYIPGYAKLYYTDSNGADQAKPLADTIVSGSGASLGYDLPTNHYIYVTYKAKVASSAPAGTYAAANQVWNASGINIASNNAKVTVSGQTQAASVSLVSSLYNVTKGETRYSTSTNANRGDEIIYRMTITNTTNTTASNLNAYTQLPNGLEYVGGYAKLYYTDANGTDRVSPLGDSLVGNGVVIGDLPAMHYVYLTYKVRVNNSAPAGTYAAANQVWNASGINIAANNASVNVIVDSQVSRNLYLKATAYNATAAKSVGFSDNVSANRGDIVKFRVDFANVGNTALKNARITNALPANMTYVNGSMKVVLGGATISKGDDIINSGATFGDLSVGATGYMEFNAKVNSNTPSNVAQLVYKANGSADQMAQVSSLVSINLATSKGDEQLPDTGTPTTTIALILLALFIAVASYIYLKESDMLKKAVKLVNKK